MHYNTKDGMYYLDNSFPSKKQKKTKKLNPSTVNQEVMPTDYSQLRLGHKDNIPTDYSRPRPGHKDNTPTDYSRPRLGHKDNIPTDYSRPRLGHKDNIPTGCSIPVVQADTDTEQGYCCKINVT
ncbi:hypothetical protein C1N86_28095 (plasmid) [Priestia aryabhattai]